jgi:hypothetical protein
VRLRQQRLVSAVAVANQALSSLNRLHSSSLIGHTTSSHTFPSPFQARTQTVCLRAALRHLRRRDLSPEAGQCDQLPSPLTSLLGTPFDSFASYASPSTPAVPLVAAEVSLPAQPPSVRLLDLLPEDVAARYADPAALLAPSPPPRSSRIYVGGDRREYAALVLRLRAAGMVAFTTAPRVINGLFFVRKGHRISRMILDAQPANAMFVSAPHTALPTPAVLAAMVSDDLLWFAKHDIGDYYHMLILPEAWWQYFAVPAVRAGDVGLGDQYGADCMIYPMFCTLPMGFSHAVFLAQEAHVHAILTRRLRLPVEERLVNQAVFPVAGRAHACYIDDLGLVQKRRADVLDALLSDAAAEYAAAGLPGKPAKIVWASQVMVLLGTELDGDRLQVGVPVQRLCLLVAATRELLTVGHCSGRTLARLLGHWTWAVLVRRPLLSIFSSVYRFIEVAGHRDFNLWPSVRAELEVMVGLAPLCFSSIRDGWWDRVVAVDSSSQGLGVVAARVPPSVVRAEAALASASGEHTTLSRYSTMRAEAVRAGIAGADDGLSSDVAVTSRRMPPPSQVSDRLLQADWRVIVSSRWHHEEHINMLEMRAALVGLRWAVSHPSCMSTRLLLLSDSRVAVGALAKGRSSSRRLLSLCRKFAVVSLSAGVVVYHRWIRSADNPADEPSRRF